MAETPSTRRQTAMPLRFVVFYGSVRSARQGIKAARFIDARCRERGHQTALVDAREHRLPLLDKMYKEYEPEDAPKTLRAIADVLIPADAFIIVSGEYNHTVPPGLSNLLDHFMEEYLRKPSGIVCYSAGPFGGVRAAIALRPILAELGMSSIPSVLPIPRVQDAFDDDGNPSDPKYVKRADKFLGELEWYAHALREARAKDADKPTRPERSFREAVEALAALRG